MTEEPTNDRKPMVVIRVLEVDGHRVTAHILRQADEVRPSELEPIGRVRIPRHDGSLEDETATVQPFTVVGRHHETGILVRARVTLPTHEFLMRYLRQRGLSAVRDPNPAEEETLLWEFLRENYPEDVRRYEEWSQLPLIFLTRMKEAVEDQDGVTVVTNS